MGRYLQLKEKIAEFSKETYDYIGYAEVDDYVNFYDFQALCFTATEDGSSIALTNNGDNTPKLYYSLKTKNGEYKEWDYSAITLNNGDKVYMYGDNASGFSTSFSVYSKFVMTGKIKASGNIQALISKDAPNEIPNSYCYINLFNNCTSLIQGPSLPATTLQIYCYMYMFKGCTNLATAPKLPTTELADYCYAQMFNGCTSLTTAPKLPATELANGCYNNMFCNCTNLTTAPELPATELANYCYASMFSSCTSLTTAPELPATELVSRCYEKMFGDCTNLNYIKALFTTVPSAEYTSNWVSGVASSGTFVKNSAATWDVVGANGVPSNWTIETAAS